MAQLESSVFEKFKIEKAAAAAGKNAQIAAGDPVVVAALKKEAAFSTNNQPTLESIAALEAQQTPRLLRGVTLADPWSVTKLKSLEAKISTLRKTLV